jgi:hypothetical protein
MASANHIGGSLLTSLVRVMAWWKSSLLSAFFAAPLDVYV